ncbi:MAG: DNA-processing protein DprA [Candidatus Pacebacteria bacterium]|nr:DNA-processing protein DprA [Candidatus Paceibacterota bacterium]
MDFDIKTVSIKDKNYPKILRSIKNPPQLLYYAGRLSKGDENCLAIVGSRIPSDYGKQVCKDIGGKIAKSNIIIVSGLAKGIDGIAHECAISNNKRTIAVLGSGIDYNSFYPKENFKLAEKILENDGLIISEYPINTKPSRYSFPDRNRIISGLSFGVLVIEARLKSGSLITANYAKEQGKYVFAIPNSIYAQNSRGCLELIKNEAKIVTDIEDIFTEARKNNLPLFYKNDRNIKIKGDNYKENIILMILSKSEVPLGIESLIKLSGLLPAEIIATLTILEIKNKIIDIRERNYLIK